MKPIRSTRTITSGTFGQGAIAVAAVAAMAVGGVCAAQATPLLAAPNASLTVLPPGDSGSHSRDRWTPVLVAGRAVPGQTLTALAPVGLDEKNATVTGYQWSVDGVPVDGATAQTFTVGTDVAAGSVVTVDITIALADGTTVTKTGRSVVQAVLTSSATPTISATGTAVGSTLTVDPASAGWNPTPDRYWIVWLSDGRFVGTGTSYLVTQADAGRPVLAKVIAYADGYGAATAVSDAVQIDPLVAPAPPADQPVTEPVDDDPGAGAGGDDTPVTSDPGGDSPGDADFDGDGWADGDHDRDGRVDGTGWWWGRPDGGYGGHR